MNETSCSKSPTAGLSALLRFSGLVLPFVCAAGLQGCAVVSVADAAVSVASTAVKVTATVVETTVDVAASGVKAATDDGNKTEAPGDAPAEAGR